MGLLDDAIREHLDLQRRRGADPAEVERQERDALGPVRRMAGPDSVPQVVAENPLTEDYEQPGDDPGLGEWNEGSQHPSDAELHAHADAYEHDFDDEEPHGASGDEPQPVSFRPRSLRDRLLRRPAQSDEEWHDGEPFDDEQYEAEHRYEPEEGVIRGAHARSDPFADEHDPFADEHDPFARAEGVHPATPEPPGDGVHGYQGEAESSDPSGLRDPRRPQPGEAETASGQPIVEHLDQPTVEYDAVEEAEARGEHRSHPARPAAASEDAPRPVRPAAATDGPPRPAADPQGPARRAAANPAGQPEEDPLEVTPEFLHDTPDHDRLWFEQRPPKDFDFNG